MGFTTYLRQGSPGDLHATESRLTSRKKEKLIGRSSLFYAKLLRKVKEAGAQLGEITARQKECKTGGSHFDRSAQRVARAVQKRKKEAVSLQKAMIRPG